MHADVPRSLDELGHSRIRRILIVCPDQNPVGGVRQHCLRLAEQLAREGKEALVADQVEAVECATADIVHLHYVPFAFGMHGLAVLPLVRRLQRLGPLVVTFHEPRTTFRMAAREAVLAPLQAIPLAGVKAMSRQMIIPTRRWARFFPADRVTFIPAGSSLPPEIEPVNEASAGGQLRVGMLYSRHPGRFTALAIEACQQVAARTGAATLCIGGSIPGIASTPTLDIAAFGAELGRCQIIVLPYADGVTGRRTSFISALQVGAPIVTTTLPDQPDFGDTTAL